MEYFIKVNITLTLFYCFYQLALKQSAYFAANRTFLLSGLGLAFILPSFRLPGAIYLEEIRDIPAAAGVNAVFLDPVPLTAGRMGFFPADPVQWLCLIYAIIAAIFLLKIFFSLFRIFRLYRDSRTIQCDGYRLVLLGNSKEPAFSLFSLIFVNAEDLSRADQWIIRHELVHVRQFHSLDILASEIVKALLWINPIAYLYQRSLRSVNEYLADSVVKPEEKDRYAELMYEYSFQNRHTTLQNSFLNKTLLKRRIKMLHQKKSGKMRLAYLLIIPLLIGLVFTVSRAGSKGRSPGEAAVISGIAAVSEGSGISTGSASSKASLNTGRFITVSGKVTDINNAPLAGASVFVKDTPHGTATDKEGHFELRNISSDALLKFSMLGYEIVQVELNNNRVVNVRLERKRQRLDEMVLVSYRQEKKDPAEDAVVPPNEVVPPNTDSVVYKFASLEKMPEFPGGKQALIRHIAKRFRYPTAARNSNTQGTVEVGFIVDKGGNVTKPEILKGIGKGCDEELIRVIKTLPKWEPGEQNGSKVAVYYILPAILKVN